jgi:uncharacterized pyridoxal phosphate-containing UPF0001 family protein
MTQLAENLERLEAEIAAACNRAGRPRSEVELMAVSKTYPAATLAEAAALGLMLFGENRVQEFAGKAPELAALRVGTTSPIDVHLIGHLQSNKAQRAVELFDAVDSLDSVRLAEKLNEAAGRCAKRLPILIEVKLSRGRAIAGADAGIDSFATARADDHCAVWRAGGGNPCLLPQLKHLAGAVGRGLSGTCV